MGGHSSMKVFVVSFFIGSALCAPQYAPAPAPYHPAPAPYHPAPAPYHPAPHPAPYHEEKLAPQPFAYEYGGADAYGRHFAKTETQDAAGVVKGEYRVELPDGRVQIVTYHAPVHHAAPLVHAPVHHAVHHAQPVFHGAPV